MSTHFFSAPTMDGGVDRTRDLPDISTNPPLHATPSPLLTTELSHTGICLCTRALTSPRASIRSPPLTPSVSLFSSRPLVDLAPSRILGLSLSCSRPLPRILVLSLAFYSPPSHSHVLSHVLALFFAFSGHLSHFFILSCFLALCFPLFLSRSTTTCPPL